MAIHIRELGHMIMELGNTSELPIASWKVKKASGIIYSMSESSRNWNADIQIQEKMDASNEIEVMNLPFPNFLFWAFNRLNDAYTFRAGWSFLGTLIQVLIAFRNSSQTLPEILRNELFGHIGVWSG